MSSPEQSAPPKIQLTPRDFPSQRLQRLQEARSPSMDIDTFRRQCLGALEDLQRAGGQYFTPAHQDACARWVRYLSSPRFMADALRHWLAMGGGRSSGKTEILLAVLAFMLDQEQCRLFDVVLDPEDAESTAVRIFIHFVMGQQQPVHVCVKHSEHDANGRVVDLSDQGDKDALRLWIQKRDGETTAGFPPHGAASLVEVRMAARTELATFLAQTNIGLLDGPGWGSTDEQRRAAADLALGSVDSMVLTTPRGGFLNGEAEKLRLLPGDQDYVYRVVTPITSRFKPDGLRSTLLDPHILEQHRNNARQLGLDEHLRPMELAIFYDVGAWTNDDEACIRSAGSAILSPAQQQDLIESGGVLEALEETIRRAVDQPRALAAAFHRFLQGLLPRLQAAATARRQQLIPDDLAALRETLDDIMTRSRDHLPMAKLPPLKPSAKDLAMQLQAALPGPSLDVAVLDAALVEFFQPLSAAYLSQIRDAGEVELTDAEFAGLAFSRPCAVVDAIGLNPCPPVETAAEARAWAVGAAPTIARAVTHLLSQHLSTYQREIYRCELEEQRAAYEQDLGHGNVKSLQELLRRDLERRTDADWLVLCQLVQAIESAQALKARIVA